MTFKKDAGLVQPPNEANRGKGKVPFGEHSTGQSKNELEAALGTTGKIVSIFETINAVHIKMDAKEADKLSRDKRVLSVEQDRTVTPQATQVNPGWGLDRLDSPTPALDNAYNYVNTGAGRTIYILDSGLALSNLAVAVEFGGRASIIYDVDGGTGEDCFGHGTMVASAVGGNTLGIAKGATLHIAKIMRGCTWDYDLSASILAFNWLAANAPKGTIVNWSNGLMNFPPVPTCNPLFSPALEDAIIKAHTAGIIVVVPAANDGCNTADFSPTNIPQAFVVGATGLNRIPGWDEMASLPGEVTSFSRRGWNISTFAPGQDVNVMTNVGSVLSVNGTSISTAYVSGMFAVACQYAGTFCDSGDTAGIYTAMRNTGTLGTVVNLDGSPLTDSTSRFIRQQW